jgi:3-oxoacyl-[acyl-carrier-protein] synthase-1
MTLGAAGIVCPVGLTASSACAGLRAGIAGFYELPYWDRDNSPVVGAPVPGLSLDLQFGPRLVEMLASALRDCLSATRGLPIQKVPLLVGLAEPDRPGGGGGPSVAETVIAQVQEKLGTQFHPQLSRTIPRGSTAGINGLQIARDLLRTGDVPGCLVCGVDSYINASSLDWLDRHWRLKRQGHTDGVIPGEAAAVIYVQRPQSGTTDNLAKVIGLGFGREQAPVLSGEPLLGLGLADAARQALAEAGWGFHEIDFRLSDLTGENYGFREQSLAAARLTRVVRSEESQPIWHAADAIGDTGASAGVVQLAWAAAAWARGFAPGPRAACFTSSVSGERAVAALQGPAA